MTDKLTGEALIDVLHNGTEEQLQKLKLPFPETKEELMSYIDAVVHRKHDYGTASYCMSIAAVLAFGYAAHVEGTTGFQAGCANMDIIRRTQGLKHGFRLLNYTNLLYPQYYTKERFPSLLDLVAENMDMLKKEATEMLKDFYGHPEVKEHLEFLSRGELPPALTR